MTDVRGHLTIHLYLLMVLRVHSPNLSSISFIDQSTVLPEDPLGSYGASIYCRESLFARTCELRPMGHSQKFIWIMLVEKVLVISKNGSDFHGFQKLRTQMLGSFNLSERLAPDPKGEESSQIRRILHSRHKKIYIDKSGSIDLSRISSSISF
ncbi:unnamed protein product [Rhizophagus irregularis]|nr:unnamed protein product [Rhizophagus irregularis]